MKLSSEKYVYFFGDGKAEGAAEMKNLLGGKGANIAEMTNLGIPVPSGFTITTEVCTYYYDQRRDLSPSAARADVDAALAKMEKVMDAKFGDPDEPAASLLPLRRPYLHARHDGHRFEHRPERHHHRRA
jgi:pyruvate,orthophosphate dikinase